MFCESAVNKFRNWSIHLYFVVLRSHANSKFSLVMLIVTERFVKFVVCWILKKVFVRPKYPKNRRY